MSKTGFEVGDDVTWTRRKRSGRTLTFTAMEAKVIELSEVNPEIVMCKYRNGKKVRIHTSRLRHASQRNELTDMVLDKEEKKA